MDEVISTLERNGLSFVNSAMRVKTKKKGKPHMAIRIDIPATTPTAVTSMLWEDLVNSPIKPEYGGEFINKRKIQCAEKMIRSAFVELYKGLGLLKTYRLLFFNHLIMINYYYFDSLFIYYYCFFTRKKKGIFHYIVNVVVRWKT